MRAGTVLEIEPSVDVVAANVSHASIDAAITGRFTGRIRANAVVFDKLMNLTPRTVISGDYAISSMPCGYVRMASR
jgi:hypothetical protein